MFFMATVLETVWFSTVSLFPQSLFCNRFVII
jgi:hypothetical protein